MCYVLLLKWLAIRFLKDLEMLGHCRDPSLWETRGTHLTVTRGTCYQPDHHHPDSLKIYMMRFSYPDSVKEDQTTLVNIASGRIYNMHPDNQHMSSGYKWPDHWLKKSESYTLSQQTAMAHILSPSEWEDKMKWQQVTSHDHSTRSRPTISDSRITYYGFWQPLVGWWCSYWRLLSS